jgi:uncharacterized membrane protein YbhN (UPF0104 family)
MVAGVVAFVGPGALGRSLASAEPGWLLAAMAAALASLGIVAVKLYWLLRAARHPVPLRRCASAALAAVTLNAVLPGRGGDLARALLLADSRQTLPVVVGAVVTERLIDVFALGALAVGASLAVGDAEPVRAIGLGACGLALLGLVLLATGSRLPLVRRRAERLGGALRHMLRARLVLAGALGASTLGWLSMVAAMLCCFRAVGSTVPTSAIAAATPIGILAGTLPVSVAGIGTRDAAMLWLLRDDGAAPEIAAATLLYAMTVFGVLPALGALVLGRETLRRLRLAARGEAS